MLIIGIDPGLSGAIAVLDNQKVKDIFDMPVMSEGKKNKRQLNSAQLVELIKQNEIGELQKMESFCGKNIVEKKNIFGFKKLKINQESRLFKKDLFSKPFFEISSNSFDQNKKSLPLIIVFNPSLYEIE